MANKIAIDTIKISQFGCVQDVSLKLTPIHALIGPNDSGKSTILRAIRTAMQLLWGNFEGEFPEKDSDATAVPFHPGINDKASISITTYNALQYKIAFTPNEVISENLHFPNDCWFEAKRRIWDYIAEARREHNFDCLIPDEELLKVNLPSGFGTTHKLWNAIGFKGAYQELKEKLLKRKYAEISAEWGKILMQKPRMVRLDPDSLRMPGYLIPSSQQIEMKNEKGIGLASIYDALINKNINGFLTIREKTKELFPTISSINMNNIYVNNKKDMAKTLELELTNGTKVSSQFISEGVLYYLAFAALQYLEPASILLVEEPENGLHPSRIKDIMKVLREISKTTQVLIATHSPLVINELKEDEVSVVWRDDEEGTKVIPIKDTKNFKERSKVYALGELWLSYADGINEQPLRKGEQ